LINFNKGDYKIERDLIVDQIFEVLKKQILAGKLKPNERLIEKQIANSFNVSRSPVREALAKLEHEGLVYRKKQYRRVEVITEKKIVEQYQLWQMIEGYGAQLACQNVEDKDIQKLENICQKMESNVEDLAMYRNLNLSFHEQLVQSCPNKKIIEMHTQVITHNRWVMNFTLMDEMDPKLSISDHRNILEAYKEKQLVALENYIRSHIENALKRVKNNFNRYSEYEGSSEDIL
jgi:DNA-binding GntR family transcriptional regulator